MKTYAVFDDTDTLIALFPKKDRALSYAGRTTKISTVKEVEVLMDKECTPFSEDTFISKQEFLEVRSML